MQRNQKHTSPAKVDDKDLAGKSGDALSNSPGGGRSARRFHDAAAMEKGACPVPADGAEIAIASAESPRPAGGDLCTPFLLSSGITAQA